VASFWKELQPESDFEAAERKSTKAAGLVRNEVFGDEFWTMYNVHYLISKA